MKNSRDTTSGRPDAHSLENPQEAPGSGPGWIRTSDTQNDDPGLGEPRGANESVGDGGSRPLEPVTPAGYVFEGVLETMVGPYELRIDGEDVDDALAEFHGYRVRLSLERLPAGEAILVTQDPHPALPDANDQPSLLTLEDRLLVALAARKNQRIGELICSSWPLADARYDDLWEWLVETSDEALVLAVEAEVFGDALGLLRAEREGVSGVNAVLHREGDVRQ